MTARLPRVLFDISIASEVYSRESDRTGIFRVLEGFLNGLAKCKEIELELFAGQIPFATMEKRYNNLYNSLSFVESKPELQRLGPKYNEFKRFLFKRIVKHNRTKTFLFNQSLKLFSSPIDQRSLAAADILHSDFFGFPPEAISAKHLARVITIHDLAILKFPQWYHQNLRDLFGYCMNSIRDGDHAFCVSESTRNDLITSLPHLQGRAFVVYPAASRDIFYPCTDPIKPMEVRRAYGLGEAPFILCLSGGQGASQGNKNLPHVINSFAKLIGQEHLKDLKLVIVAASQKDLESQISTQQNAKELRQQIVHITRVHDSELAALYSTALLFAFPSKYEGFGLPVLEAMQCGAPVLVSNTSSLPEVAGDAGILLNPSSEDDWCQAMLEVYSSSTVRASLSQKSLERSKLFTWERTVEKIVSAYKDILHIR